MSKQTIDIDEEEFAVPAEVTEQKQLKAHPKVMRTSIRANEAMKKQRLTYVLKLLQQGMAKHMIIAEMERVFDIAPRTVEKYIAQAYGLLREAFSNEVEVNKTLSVQWLIEHRDRCLEESEFAVALQTQKEIDLITGLQSNKVELTGKDGKDLPIVINIIPVEPKG